jgi:spore germination protein GerM
MRNIIAAIVVLVAVAGIGYYLLHLEKEHHSGLTAPPRKVLDVDEDAIEAHSSGDLRVKVYFYRLGATDPNDDFLQEEERSIHDTGDALMTARQIVNEVIKEQSGEGDSLSSETRLREIYLLEDGTAVVDFSAESVRQLGGGITSELGIIYAVTRSLRSNLPQVARVKFVVEGEERPTFGSHVCIREPFM